MFILIALVFFLIFGKDRNGICDHFKDIFDENVELEKKNTELRLKLDALEGQTPWKDIKDKSELIGKLTKATELLRFWVNDFYDGFNNLNRYEERHKALEQSEQFLKEQVMMFKDIVYLIITIIIGGPILTASIVILIECIKRLFRRK